MRIKGIVKLDSRTELVLMTRIKSELEKQLKIYGNRDKSFNYWINKNTELLLGLSEIYLEKDKNMLKKCFELQSGVIKLITNLIHVYFGLSEKITNHVNNTLMKK